MQFRLFLITLLLLFSKIAKSQFCELAIGANPLFLCEGDCANLSAIVFSGTAPYQYTWATGDNTMDIVVCTAGQYSLTVTDATGASCVADVIIWEGDVEVSVDGTETCVDANGTGDITFFANASGGAPPYAFAWSGPNGYFSNNSVGSVSNVTEDNLGEYCVTITDSNGCTTTDCITYSSELEPEIEIIAGPFCPDDLNECQKVCENTSFTYTVSNTNGEPVEWNIQGAESYEVNDDQVTVTWGSAGFGEVSVFAGPPEQAPFHTWCGQISDTFADGSAAIFIYAHGGEEPYNVTHPVGIDIFMGSGLATAGPIPGGTYVLQVEDAAGNQGTCEFTIAPPGGPWLSVFPDIVDASDCNTCDGEIDINNFGANNGGTCNWEWSNGNQELHQNLNLCPGIYSVTLETCDPVSQVVLDIPVGCPNPGPSCSGESSLCIEILEEPIAQITTDPPHSNGSLTICKDQLISFTNQSIGASGVVWDFGDFSNSVLDNPVHSYPTAGVYNVQLIAFNDCFCADTSNLIINVTDLEVPEIKCTGTVCEGETVTYETEALCNSYQWSITGDGLILDGGGSGDNFITVEWNGGPEGNVSLAVSSCNPELCDAATSVSIPIITDEGNLIVGADKVCPGTITNYSITNFGGIDFNWQVSNGGQIIDGQGSNQISVEWFATSGNNPQSVSVDYENCYLGCGGSDELEVNILDEFYIQGAIEICQNDSASYQSILFESNTGFATNWSIIDENGQTVWNASNPTSNVLIEWNFAPGNYTLQSIPENANISCLDFSSIEVVVLELPPLPSAIEGEFLICPNSTYSYGAIGLPAHEFFWLINNGGNITEDVGNTITVTWASNGPYEISLSQISPTGNQCMSPFLMETISPIQSLSITGDAEVCIEHTVIYSTTELSEANFQWEIMPANSGTIINNDNHEIEVLWHESGLNTVQLNYCDLSETIQTMVFDNPEPLVNFPASLCPNETSAVSTSIPYVSYEWRTEGGTLVSIDSSPNLFPGYYEVIVIDDKGCQGNTLFHIEGYPAPQIGISSPGNLAWCPGGDPIDIFALESNNGYDYQWFMDGTAFGGNTSSISINETGSYQVIITDNNGCTAASNTLFFEDCAFLGGICIDDMCTFPLPPDTVITNVCVGIGNIDFTHSVGTACNIVDFQNTSFNFIPDSFFWEFDDNGSGSNNFSTLTNPSHTFSQPGYYNVRLYGDVLGTNAGEACFDWVEHIVVIPAAADFSASAGCINDPIFFTDISTFLPDSIDNIVSWNWDFGDPASGIDNTSTDQNPDHTFPDDGIYLVTLTITTDSGCTSSISKEVSVNPPPEFSFIPLTLNCALTPLEFNLDLGDDITNVVWGFGDPSTGSANSSEQFTTYHNFSQAGNFVITITTTNIYGCTKTTAEVINIDPNELSGTIDFSQPSPICQGSSTLLSAPAGGTQWLWSTGDVGNSILVFEEGIYSVTITDDQGCIYTPPSAFLEVLPAPLGSIQAVEFNEFDQPSAFFENSYAICEGEEVYLQIQSSSEFTFEWSNDELGTEISFTEEKDNLLSQGTYTYTVTITNEQTGCTAITAPFEVVVHPSPNDVQISSDPPAPICDGTFSTLSVSDPDPMLTYIWNTGEQSQSIEVIAAGSYFVRAINDFGCESLSNSIEIFQAPDINKIPDGCHTRCGPDTLCLPNLPTVVNYQWYLEGSPINAPNGTDPNLIATESGEYTLEMTDINGCVALSDPVYLDILEGFGNILGNVYFDVNENGVIDATDTLVSDISIFLIENGTTQDTSTSDNNGLFAFTNILSTEYGLLINTNNFPPNWFAYQPLINTELVGCDAESTVDFLLFEQCVPEFGNLTLSTCPDSIILYENVPLSPGDSQNFTLLNQYGCDSIVTVSVNALQVDQTDFPVEICEGTTYEYENIILSIGDSQDFTFNNQFGCDSIVTVTVSALEADQTELPIQICEGSTFEYENTILSIGESQDFTFLNQMGCDSIVSVNVSALPSNSSDLTLFVCEGNLAEYNGEMLSIGTIQEFIHPDQNGCDSTVTVTVEGLNPSESTLVLFACLDEFIEYAGTILFPGDQQSFVFENAAGCDSIVSVQVNTFEISTSTLEVTICEGDSFEYAGVSIDSNTEMLFALNDQNGCDSMVLVQVNAFPSLDFNYNTSTSCENIATGSLEITNYQNGIPPFQFSINGTDFQNTPIFPDLLPEDYTLFVQDGNDCLHQSDAFIPASPNLSFSIANPIIPCGDSILVLPEIQSFSNFYEYQIIDPSTNNLIDGPISTPGEYLIQVMDFCDTISQNFSAQLEVDGRTEIIHFPNVFSPNDDGFNDAFRAFVPNDVQVLQFELKLFDRWGNLLFESNNIENSWDGHFRGEKMDTGVYVWYLEAQLIACQKELNIFQKGDVLLLK